MSEITEKSDAPLAVVREEAITEILGNITCDGSKHSNNGAENNTRWVFDILHKGADASVSIKLLSYRSQQPIKPDLMTFYVTPLDRGAAKALSGVWMFHDTENGALVVSMPHTEKARFRISVDVMHTAHR